MKNSEKYLFSDFTYENYKNSLLELLKKNYDFVFYDECGRDKGITILRHDIDFSPQLCVPLAEIEFKLGIQSTYFVLLRSEWYNLLHKNQLVYLRKIEDLGHRIGLHFDLSCYPKLNTREVHNAIRIEANFLNQHLSRPVNAFSFHNPDNRSKNFRDSIIAGLHNVYSETLAKKFEYVSDSNGIWRFKRLSDFVRTAIDEPLHILIHPELWTSDITSPRQRVELILKKASEEIYLSFQEEISKSGREMIDW